MQESKTGNLLSEMLLISLTLYTLCFEVYI